MNRFHLSRRGRCTVIAALCAAALGSGGCSEYADEFRAASASSFRSGFEALADGIVAGAFAVFEPDQTTDESAARPAP